MVKQQSKGNSAAHMCDLVNAGASVETKYLAEEPEYMCMECGRLADNSENLCNPWMLIRLG